MAQTFAQSFAAARRVSAPIVLVRTPDNIASQKLAIDAAMTVKSDKLPATPMIAAWDYARGLTTSCWPSKNTEVVKAQQTVLDAVLTKSGLPQGKTTNPSETISALLRSAPVGTIVFFHNLHLLWSNPSLVQALANVRDDYKTSFRMVVILAPLGTTPPPELKHDMILLNDPLPDSERLQEVVTKTAKGSGVNLDEANTTRARDMVRGLSAFVAENAVAMALRSKGIDWPELLSQRKEAFESVKGVTLYTGTESLDDVIGHEGLKADVRRFKNARNRVRVIVVLDEFGKMLAGSQTEHGDNTGTAQRQHGAILRWMSDHRVRGQIYFGDPGTGKSMLAKALANELDCICILGEMDKMMDSKLGATEQNLNAFIDMVNAIAGDGGALVLATCNEIVPFSTELRRRFVRGTYYFGRIDAETRDRTWRHYCQKYGLDPEQPRPADEGWTPSEIAVCCEQAYDYNTTLLEGARNIVPICQQQPEAIADRRRAAHGRLLDTATGLLYQMPDATGAAPVAMSDTRGVATLPD